jgi:hypothetical protein
VDRWLLEQAEDLKKAQISLEYARAAMMRAHKKGMQSHQYAIGDQVTTEHLAVRGPSSQAAKLMPRYVGPFTIAEQVNPGAYRLILQSSYAAVHDAFNESALRPLQ